MKTIPLTQGQFAIVDDEDFENLSKYKWWASYQKRRKVYVAKGFVNGKAVWMHRFIMGVTDPKIDVDHRFHNPLDNQRANLRVCSRGQNNANARKRKDAITSRFKGVSWFTRDKKWKAQISVNGRHFHVGCYSSQEAAALAYNRAALKHYGEFACINKLSKRQMEIARIPEDVKPTTSKYRGVTWNKKANKWMAQHEFNKKRYYLGLFESEEQAALVYNQAIKKHAGCQSPINQI